MALPTSTPSPEDITKAPAPELFPDGPDKSPDASLCATVDEDGNVLELIYSNRDGIYIRDTGEWSLIDTSVSQPTVDDQEWFDVVPDFVTVFDGMIASEDGISRDDIVKYAAPQDYDTPES